MCRCKNEHSGGRRCPADTQEARRLRLHKSKAIAEYSALVEKPYKNPDNNVENENLVEGTVIHVQTIRDEVSELKTLVNDQRYWTMPAGIPEVRDWLAEIDSKLVSIGLNVEFLAETKYGAPTDAELSRLAEINDRAKIAIADEYDAKIKQQNEKYEQKIEAYRLNSAIYDARFEEELSSRNFTPETYPIMRERYEAFEAEYPEIWASLTEQKKELDVMLKEREAVLVSTHALHEEKREKILALAVTYDSEIGQKLKARNEGIKSALTEVGVDFAAAGELKVSDKSHKKALKSVNAVLHYYPKEWVDNSNNNMRRELKIKDSVGRAHYSNGRIQKTRTSSLRFTSIDKDETWKPDPYDRTESEYIPVVNGEWVDPKGKTNTIENSPESGKKTWVKMTYEYKKWVGETEPPETVKGYPEKRQFWEEKWDSNARKFYRTGKLETYYRKPKTVVRTSMDSITAELLVSPTPPSPTNKTANSSVAIHELAHRMEATNPHILQMERAFLLRRAGVLGQNPNKLTQIYPGHKKEIGYKDEFINHYMGKVYRGDYYEILSTGMEALYEGRFGGFVGMDGEKRDPDYKRAILGILASSSKK